MADVSSRGVTTLPGYTQSPPNGMDCDDHPGVPAVKRVQGETDSFGAEFHDLCQACYDKHRAAIAENPMTGSCDWCKKGPDLVLRHRRDMDEGQGGPVYRVCDSCIDRDNARAAEELEHYRSESGVLDDDWDPLGADERDGEDDFDDDGFPNTRPPEVELLGPPTLTDVIAADEFGPEVSHATLQALARERKSGGVL